MRATYYVYDNDLSVFDGDTTTWLVVHETMDQGSKFIDHLDYELVINGFRRSGDWRSLDSDDAGCITIMECPIGRLS